MWNPTCPVLSFYGLLLMNNDYLGRNSSAWYVFALLGDHPFCVDFWDGTRAGAESTGVQTFGFPAIYKWIMKLC